MARKRITAAQTRALCGGRSDMTLWRWLNDPEMNFPKPIYIRRQRYWWEDEVVDWLDRAPQSGEAA